MKTQVPVRTSSKPVAPPSAERDGSAPPERVVQASSFEPQSSPHDFSKMAPPSSSGAAGRIGQAGAHARAAMSASPSSSPRATATGTPPLNHTGLPSRLRAGIENLSGLSMDDVRVHFRSARPAHVRARAYTRGTEIYVGPGQEAYLPHEAWHVVQQKQGRVKPTLRLKGCAINDEISLEREADDLGEQAATLAVPAYVEHLRRRAPAIGAAVQRASSDDEKVASKRKRPSKQQRYSSNNNSNNNNNNTNSREELSSSLRFGSTANNNYANNINSNANLIDPSNNQTGRR